MHYIFCDRSFYIYLPHNYRMKINVDDIVGGVFIAKDGQADPVGVTNVLAKGAKLNGANIIENCSGKHTPEREKHKHMQV